MKLIFIHGRAQEGKDPVKMKTEWKDALTKGLKKSGLSLPTDLEIVLPFYGDTLDALIKQLDTPLVEDVVFKGAVQDSAEAEFRGELLREIADALGVTEKEIQSFYNEEGEAIDKGARNWRWVHAILKALDGKTSLGGLVLERIVRDVYVYLSYPAVRRQIDAIVSGDLTPGPCVIVAHSLGSVVGYNVLRDTSIATDVKRYVTVGSPLGIRSIKEKLQTPIKMPSRVADWYNGRDPHDVVALHPLNATHFPITPEIENDSTVDNPTSDQHGITGYLIDADVAKKIYQALMHPI
ncbi:MAG: hypothetical protein ACI8PD_002177 [Nitrospinales bacterium]|jgi:hypothetical protein